MKPHSATQILLWMAAAVMVQTMQSAVWLSLCAGVLLLLAFRMHTERLFKLMHRARWIFFSLLLIYAYATPGEALWVWEYAPTREGLLDGLMQLTRLVCVLAGLSILLTLLSREDLIGGLYALVYPARYFGLSRERIAVRLALTLHYAEGAMRDTSVDWRSAIADALAPVAAVQRHVELRVGPFNWADGLLLMVVSALLLRAWL